MGWKRRVGKWSLLAGFATPNTILIMKRLLSLPFILSLLIFTLVPPRAMAQTSPEFLSGEDPRPAGKQWELVPLLSDEFDSTALDTFIKWRNTDDARWKGRVPGRFKRNTVSMANGNMRITNYQLSSPEYVTKNNGEIDTFTHACGHVISRNQGQVGYYFESSFRANKTFLSSTFWLINYKNEETGCDRRVTELDIQECVGIVNSTASWTQDFDQSMHSNTHSRNVSCGETTGSLGDDTLTSGKVWADYHTYGAYWESATEIKFFLDGEYVYSVTPVVDFDIPMYIKLVTETYDWNPVPADGGMTGSWTERTTFYDWVRTWKLVDAPCSDAISFDPPTSVPSQDSYTLDVTYTACQSRDIVVEFWDNGWLGADKITVPAGVNQTASLTINLNNAPAPGSNYIWKTSIRPVGTTWQDNIDTDQQPNVTVTPVITYASFQNLGSSAYMSYQNPNQMSTATSVGSTEKFVIEDQGDGTVALRGTNGLFVSSENGTKEMTCTRANVGAWEKFTLEDHGNDTYALQGSNGLYLRNNMLCTSTGASNWQKWKVVTGLSARYGNPDVATQASQPTLRVHPNPLSYGATVISWPHTKGTYSLEVVDIKGAIIFQKTEVEGSYKLPRSTFRGTGIYMLKACDGTTTQFKKIIVQ